MQRLEQINTMIKPIDSVISIEEIETYLDPNEMYQVVAYTIPAIMFGEYQNGFCLGLENLEFYQIDSIRVFNSKCELYLYRYADSSTGKASATLKGRLRKDSPEADSGTSFYQDASQILIGSKSSEETATHTLLSEDRGFQLLIPSKWMSNKIAQNRLRVITRNYLSEWDNGQLSFCDHRFVAIDNHKEDL